MNRNCVLDPRVYRTEVEPPASLEDTSRYGNHGGFTDITQVRLPSGLWVMRFNGASSVIDIADAPSFNITRALSVFAWVYHEDITEGADFILSKYLNGTNNREWNFYKAVGTGELSMEFGDPNDGTFEGRQATDSVILANDTWYLVGFTFNAGTVIVYSNGLVAASAPVAGAIPITLYNGTANVKVGAVNIDAAANIWNGDIALPRIFNHALSPADIWNMWSKERWHFGV